MYQDSKGFLWLATLNGLSRYDGNSFLTFRPESGEKVSLADNRIYDLTEDKNGFLWISTTPELFSCYDLQRACFVDYTGTGALEQNYSAVFIACLLYTSKLYELDPMRLAQPRSEYPCTAPARLRIGPDWLAYAGNWMTEWERTGNTAYRDKIVTGMKSIATLPNRIFTGPKALGFDPSTGIITTECDSKLESSNHLMLSLIHIYGTG